MAKGLCPGVGRSRGIKHEYVNLNERATILLLVYLDNKCLYKKKKKKSVEKRGRERERPIFLRLHGKPIKPLHRTCTAHEGIGRPLEEVLKTPAGK